MTITFCFNNCGRYTFFKNVIAPFSRIDHFARSLLKTVLCFWKLLRIPYPFFHFGRIFVYSSFIYLPFGCFGKMFLSDFYRRWDLVFFLYFVFFFLGLTWHKNRPFVVKSCTELFLESWSNVYCFLPIRGPFVQRSTYLFVRSFAIYMIFSFLRVKRVSHS